MQAAHVAMNAGGHWHEPPIDVPTGSFAWPGKSGLTTEARETPARHDATSMPAWLTLSSGVVRICIAA
jgi:hypothetical protein